MSKYIPPLPTMRALDAAVRHESFSAAADELGITQSAISHQIKDLEIKLGISLFRRLARHTVPTEDARNLARGIVSGMSRISDAVEEIIRRQDLDSLTISVLPGFAVQWLFPRLIEFDERHPGISIALKTTDELTDVARGEADLAIRYGCGDYPDLLVEKLLDDDLFPVCSPAYLSANGPILNPQDLMSHTLLFDDTRPINGIEPTWKHWFELTGTPFDHAGQFKKFGQSNMVVQAALAGRGVALGRSALVIDDLKAGNLVIPIARTVPSGFNHYLVMARNRTHVPHIDAFRRWVHEQAEKSMADFDLLR